MKKISNWISEHKILITTVFIVFLIPALFGFINTKINYDILMYLPEDIETIDGENILSEEFNIGSFAFILTDEKDNREILKLQDKIKTLDGVNKVVSIANLTDITIPTNLLPESIIEKIYNQEKTIMLVTFTSGISESTTLSAVEKLRDLVKDASKISGMSGMVLDTKNLSESEMALYITFAVIFCFLVLLFATDSYLIPIFLLGNIGVAILLNMGTNVFLGSISYITKSITAVLQLGVTMDFSIFLYHKYIVAKQKETNRKKAMAYAIEETFKSVVGSSLTTIAGFLALCTMKLTLGMDIGLVMAKGVVCGLITVLTLFPSLLLIFDKQIEKTSHKCLLPNFEQLQNFIIKHHKKIIIVFLLIAIPAIYGNNKVEVYYKIDEALPENLPSKLANKELKEKFNIISPEIILLDKNLEISKQKELVKKLEELDGIENILTPSKITELGIPLEILPNEIKEIFQNDKYELMLINSSYEVASNELNEQISEINKIIKQYDEHAIVAGEGALTKDLVEIADHDFNIVNYISIGIIFILMLFVLKSWSLSVLLIIVIEFAIFTNMAFAFFTNNTLPFIASIVVGTIQLGATIDYAILMTTTYTTIRKTQKDKTKAMKETLKNTISSIIVSACCLFASTCGVSLISKIDMISSICKLLSRGAIISMIVVILLLPSLLLLFDKFIIKKKEGINYE